MRCRRLPATRPTSRDLQEPFCPRKKCAIWTRWRPVPYNSHCLGTEGGWKAPRPLLSGEKLCALQDSWLLIGDSVTGEMCFSFAARVASANASWTCPPFARGCNQCKEGRAAFKCIDWRNVVLAGQGVGLFESLDDRVEVPCASKVRAAPETFSLHLASPPAVCKALRDETYGRPPTVVVVNQGLHLSQFVDARDRGPAEQH